jgi:hypothetical protein
VSPSHTSSVVPERQLVELVLGSSPDEEFGTQQDINECMDHIMNLFESGLKDTDVAGNMDYLKR